MDFIDGNAIALPSQCKCITSCSCCYACNLGWRLIKTGYPEGLQWPYAESGEGQQAWHMIEDFDRVPTLHASSIAVSRMR